MLLELLSSLGGIFAGLIGMIIAYYFTSRSKAKTELKTSTSFDRLTTLLKDASSEIEKMEEEIKIKGKKAQELEELSKRFDSLVSLKEEQVEAIRTELSLALKKSSKTNRIWTIVIGAMWFFIGLFVRGFLGF